MDSKWFAYKNYFSFTIPLQAELSVMIMVPSSVYHATRPDAERIQVYLNHNNVIVSFSNSKIVFQEYDVFVLYDYYVSCEAI